MFGKKDDLWGEYIKRLLAVNDETKSKWEHDRIESELRGWRNGVQDATGMFLNGDYYYIDLIEQELMTERPMCIGVFMDWKEKETA